ncbi:hypothetical protein G7046_g253 [Stylonectria norvegica]|nr:hypothetical protein G7046_g253 [Stylonectria norvegica]
MHTSSLLQYAGLIGSAVACSRVTYKAGINDRIVIGRSMDFVGDTNTTFLTYPAGLKRSGDVEQNPFEWTSKYGSITAVIYDKVHTEGMNTEGLTGSLLYLGDSQYAERDAKKPGMFIGIWLQYYLDMYSTVAEAAKDICANEGGNERFQVVTRRIIPGIDTNAHVSFSDLKGDTLIMEFAGGKLQCYRSKDYAVMTNEPTFDQQLAINAYWAPISNQSLPGTGRPADRFARLSHYNSQIPSAADMETAVSYAAGMIRAVSNPTIPVNMKEIGTEDVWPTFWRTYIDTKDQVFFYESATSPIFFWFDFHDFDLSKAGKSKVLSLVDVKWRDRMGDMGDKFQSASQREGGLRTQNPNGDDQGMEFPLNMEL